jgi:hypothetical protein
MWVESAIVNWLPLTPNCLLRIDILRLVTSVYIETDFDDAILSER